MGVTDRTEMSLNIAMTSNVHIKYYRIHLRAKKSTKSNRTVMFLQNKMVKSGKSYQVWYKLKYPNEK